MPIIENYDQRITLPEITVIKYARTEWNWVVASPVILLASIYSLRVASSALEIVLAIFGCVLGAFLTFMSFREVRELSKAQLMLSRSGMEHRNGQRFSWSEISREQIVFLGRHH